MAVFGNLAEFPLSEVISMLERRCGVLRFTQVGRFQSLELQLNFGCLQGLLVDGLVLRNGLAAKDLLVEIANLRDGQFEFQPIPRNSELLLNDLAIDIGKVLLQRATLDDQWNEYKNSLPEPDTRFVLASQDLVYLDDDLQQFWNQAELLFEYGISTQELAQRLRLDLRFVQVHLYKLGAIGLIQSDNFSSRVPPLKAAKLPESKSSLVTQVLGALHLIKKSRPS